MYVFIYLFEQNIWPCPHEEDFTRMRVQQGVYKNIIYIIYIYIHAHNYTYTIAHTGILRYSAHLCVYARLCTCRFVSARTNPHDKGWINLDLRFFRATPKGAGLQLKGNGVLVCNRHH
jgi:hypothetical protein